MRTSTVIFAAAGGLAFMSVLALRRKRTYLPVRPEGKRISAACYKAGKRYRCKLVSVGTDKAGRGAWMTPEAALGFTQLRTAAKRAGFSLRPNRTFATYAHQRRLFQEKGASLANKPGYSTHNRGIAFDADAINAPARQAWMELHAGRFGWKNAYRLGRYEKRHHWTYQGSMAW